jgi:ParB/RepB/Spo0J family partition protein
MKVQEIPIEKIRITENHRVNIDSTHLDELMQSIKQRGLIQPIGVSANGHNDYILRFGQRRLLACKKLGYKTISASIEDVAGEQNLLLENLTENMQRKDPSFAELGRIIDKLAKELSVKEISVRLGIPAPKIKQIVDVYHALPEKFRKRIVFMEKGGGRKERKGCIPAQAAMKIVEMKKHHGLKDKEVDHVFNAVVEHGMDKLDLDNVGDLIHSGMSVDAAMRNVREYGVFTLDVVAKHSEVTQLMEKHGLISRKHLFKKIIYGEIPALIKPSFVSTGIVVKKEKPKEIKRKIAPFIKIRKELTKLKLTEEQGAALASTRNVDPEDWSDEQCYQLQTMYADVTSRKGSNE